MDGRFFMCTTPYMYIKFVASWMHGKNKTPFTKFATIAKPLHTLASSTCRD
jgi:hypothetical protein